MKILVSFSRIFVAALFLFSGFIKLNDPVGFSYKLQEYFGEGVLNLEFLIPFALLISIFLVIFEIVLGITLLLGYLPKFTVWSLLLMIAFFTFLTFYSAYFNKVTDCGCFGDALPLTPWESFTKDVILLVLILVLFFGRKYITPIKPFAIHKWVVFATFTACLGFAYYVLMHLPAFDFRAYKEGVNIQEGMEVPEGAPKAEFAYHWKFDVNGEEKIVTTSGDYPKVEGKFIEVETKTVKEGYEPPIHDFAIEKNDTDYTTEFLEKENLILIVTYNLSKSEAEGLYAIKKVTDKAISQGYDVIGLTASTPKDIAQVQQQYSLDFDFYTTDETALKTILRSNPGIVKLEKGTIVKKLHWNDAEKLNLEKVTPSKPKINLILKAQLDSIMKLDQDGRSSGEISWEEQKIVDSTNTIFIEEVFKKYGYPGKTLVGEGTNIAAWLVIQHSDKIGAYLPLIKEAGEKGELDKKSVAMMEDRYLVQQGLEQIYGSQVVNLKSNSLIWPIKDAESVNERRKEVGFTETIEEYSERLLGISYKMYTLEEVKKIKENSNQ
ncbi:putative membrane protein YphA (DoxX/SURF4 family) [Aquimarina sp. MAR_2010_214]|uniref:BT_3928 family protein n=1 Tax=Aquimarina sp. MAR_2010_214 TaxID=1250026 RepID=UPI000C70CD25|nr:BT_3928 family protein [Aquimarina sp. MAR_2010_214]PKV52609.1 putative membrane protein YphA (DoxX/SURF4 family) [Aquimarina sp. MAR_2010_214]